MMITIDTFRVHDYRSHDVCNPAFKLPIGPTLIIFTTQIRDSDMDLIPFAVKWQFPVKWL